MNLTEPIIYLHSSDSLTYFCKFNENTGQWLCDSNQVGIGVWSYVLFTFAAIGFILLAWWGVRD